MKHNKYFNWALWNGLSFLIFLVIIRIEYIAMLEGRIDWSVNESYSKALIAILAVIAISGLIGAGRAGGSIKDDIGGNYNLFYDCEEYWKRWWLAQLFQLGAAMLSVAIVLMISIFF